MSVEAPVVIHPFAFLGFLYAHTPLEAWTVKRLVELDRALDLPGPEALFADPVERARSSVVDRRRALAAAIASRSPAASRPIRALAASVLRGLSRIGCGDPGVAALVPPAPKGGWADDGFQEACRADLLDAALRAAALRLRGGDPMPAGGGGPAERLACRSVEAALRDLSDAETARLAGLPLTRTVQGAFQDRLPLIGVRAHLGALLLERVQARRDPDACAQALLALFRCPQPRLAGDADTLVPLLEQALESPWISPSVVSEIEVALYGQPVAKPASPWRADGHVVHHDGRSVKLTPRLARVFDVIARLDGPTRAELAKHLSKTSESTVRDKNALRTLLHSIGLTIEGGFDKQPRLYIRPTRR